MSGLVYTGRWALMRDLPVGLLVPVRTSVGTPRFIAGAARFPAIEELMPFGLLKIDDRKLFTRRYRRRLDKLGVRRIQARLDELHKGWPGRPLVLCCFEDLATSWCHRRVWADWHEEQTGIAIPEFTAADLASLRHPSKPIPPDGPIQETLL